MMLKVKTLFFIMANLYLIHATNAQSCEIKRSDYGQYYVTVDGSRMSSNFSNIDDAISFQDNLSYRRSCYINRTRERCETKRSDYGQYYIVSRGQRVSGKYSNYNDAISFQAKLQRANICIRQNGRGGGRRGRDFSAQCQIKRSDYGQYYVVADNERMSGNYSRLEDAVNFQDNLLRNNQCRRSHPQGSCEIKRSNYGQYYITVLGSRMSGNFSRYDDAVDFERRLMRADMCYR